MEDHRSETMQELLTTCLGVRVCSENAIRNEKLGPVGASSRVRERDLWSGQQACSPLAIGNQFRDRELKSLTFINQNRRPDRRHACLQVNRNACVQRDWRNARA